MGGVWHQAGCCCECTPCGTADRESQPEVAVTILGDCLEECQNSAGAYTFTEWLNVEEWEWCTFQWGGPPPDVRVTIWFDWYTHAPIWATVANDNGWGEFEGEPFNVDVKCIGGKLRGSFDVPSLETCEGCHAHIVLGG